MLGGLIGCGVRGEMGDFTGIFLYSVMCVLFGVLLSLQMGGLVLVRENGENPTVKHTTG